MEKDIEIITEKIEEFCKKYNDVSVKLSITSGMWNNDITTTEITVNPINEDKE